MRKLPAYACLAFGAVLAAPWGQAVAAEGQYVVGVSNTLIGNGWREEMVCSIKAEALASGKVSKLVLANRNGGPPEQIADLRNLISAGVNIIIVNPSDRKALNPVIEQALAKHITVVAVDQAVSASGAYVLENDQVAYGREGAEALFKALGGKGNQGTPRLRQEDRRCVDLRHRQRDRRCLQVGKREVRAGGWR
jgi:ribose transport system substrate-binding protein